MDEHAETNSLERDRGGRTGAIWDPGDDLCPPWWPRRPLARRRPRPADAPPELLAADRVYAALTLLAASFELDDAALVREVHDLAVAHIVAGAEQLALGAAMAWGSGDDVGPPWRPGRALAAGSTPGLPAGPGGVSVRALALLDALDLLRSYGLAARLTDPGARAAATVAIGAALVEHARHVAAAFG